MATYYFTDLCTDGTPEAGRIGSDANPPVSQGVDVVDFPIGDYLWVGFMLAYYNVAACNKAVGGSTTISILVRKDGGSWESLAASDLAPPGTGNMVFTDLTPANANWFTANTTSCCASDETDGVAQDNSDSLASGTGTAKDTRREFWFAIDTTGADPNTLYEFALYDTQEELGTVGSPLVLDCSITTASAGGPARNINIDDEEGTITVTDVPTVVLPDPLLINISEPLITVTDVVTDMAQELVPSVFDEATVEDVPTVAVQDKAPYEIDVFESAIAVTDVPTVELPDPLQISIQEGIITVTDVETVELPDPLEINVFEAAIGVTDVVDDMLVYQETLKVTIAEPLITVTDVVADMALELVPSVFDGVTVEEYVDLAQELVPSVFDSVTVDEDITVTLPDALEISVEDTSGVTDEETVEVQDAEAAEDLDIDVYDEVTVTDVVDNVVVGEVIEDLEIDVFDTTTVTDVVDDIGVTEFFWTDFSEYSEGFLPGDWTEELYIGGGAAKVQLDGHWGGRCLELTHISGGRYFVGWDDIGDQLDVEVLVKARATVAYDHTPRIAIRGQGSDSNEVVYFAGFQVTQDEIIIHKYTPTSTSVGTAAFTCAEDIWYWLRFRVEGDTLKLKVWLEGDQEPAGWQIEETDTDITTAGWVGVGGYEDSADIDFFSAATRGGIAPGLPMKTIYESVSVTDVVTNIVILDQELYVISEFDTTAVTEDVTVVLPDPLLISVFSITSVTEYVDLAKELTVSVYDETSVTDVETVTVVAVGDLTVNVFDSVGVTDVVDGLCIFDWIETDFTEYTVEQQPSDWTERWNIGNATALVKTGGELGGKVLRLDHSETFPSGSKYAASWDDTDGEGDGEVLALIRSSTDHDNVAIVLRGGGGIGTEDGYLAHVNFWDGPTHISIRKLVNGSYTVVTSNTNKTLALDTWYWVRFQIHGEDLKTKIWEYLTAEPDAWDCEGSDANHATGWAGVYSGYDDDREFDYFGYAPGTCGSVPVPLDVAFDKLVFDTVTVTEDVTVSLPDALEISVFEAAITVTDVPALSFASDISVFDQTGVTDWVDVVAHLAIPVFETTAVTEQVTVELPDALQIDVFDGSGIIDWVNVTVSVIGELYVDVFSPVTVQEDVTVTLPDGLEVSVSDQIGVTESVDLLITELFVSVFDLVTLTEEVTVAPGLKISVYSETTVLESVSLALSDLALSVFDTVTVTEDTTIDILIPKNLYVDVYETVTVTEATAGIIGTVILTTYDEVTVTDVVELYWLLAAGMLNVTFAERAPDITFDPRIPAIEYAERAPDIEYRVH